MKRVEVMVRQGDNKKTKKCAGGQCCRMVTVGCISADYHYSC